MGKLLISITVFILLLSFFSCLPTKKKGITLEGKTSAPHGYTEMQKRNDKK